MDKLLIIDDNAETRKQLEWGLGKSHRLLFADDHHSAVAVFQKHQPKVVLLDLDLSPADSGVVESFRCLDTLLEIAPDTKVVVAAGKSDKEHALHAVQLGAYSYCFKPVELSELRITLHSAYQLALLEAENRLLHSTSKGSQVLPGMFGQSAAMLDVFSIVRKVAASNVPVLIVGESGTGKEMVARTIHALSSRHAELFQPINCGSIPETLLESELFGHEQGAFAGAVGQVRGKLESADNGTLLLAEVEGMSPLLQVKMLRFLQEKVVQRIGGTYDIPIDVRIIASTNIDIEKAVTGKKIREDLYYNLGVIKISLPPLRERGDDIILLSHFFLRKYAAEYNKRVRTFSTVATRYLLEYDWPGNVCELENKVRRAVVMADGPVVEPSLLGFAADSDQDVSLPSPCQYGMVCTLAGKTLQEARTDVERKLILSTFEREQNISRTARSLGISRPTLYDLMKKHNILMTT
jgi:two-component system NtrC family response regulator